MCTYNIRVLFLRARVTCLSGDPLSCCSVQSSRPELAVVQASTAMGPCLTCAWSVLTLGQVQVSVVLQRRLLANLVSLLEATGDFTVKHKTFLSGTAKVASLLAKLLFV